MCSKLKHSVIATISFQYIYMNVLYRNNLQDISYFIIILIYNYRNSYSNVFYTI